MRTCLSFRCALAAACALAFAAPPPAPRQHQRTNTDQQACPQLTLYMSLLGLLLRRAAIGFGVLLRLAREHARHCAYEVKIETCL